MVGGLFAAKLFCFVVIVVGVSIKGRGIGLRVSKKGRETIKTFKGGVGRIDRLDRFGSGGGIGSIQSWGSVAGVDI